MLTAIDLEGRSVKEAAIEDGFKSRLVERVCSPVDGEVGHVDVFEAKVCASAGDRRTRARERRRRAKRGRRNSQPK